MTKYWRGDYILCPSKQDPVWWQEFCCGWSAGLE